MKTDRKRSARRRKTVLQQFDGRSLRRRVRRLPLKKVLERLGLQAAAGVPRSCDR